MNKWIAKNGFKLLLIMFSGATALVEDAMAKKRTEKAVQSYFQDLESKIRKENARKEAAEGQ